MSPCLVVHFLLCVSTPQCVVSFYMHTYIIYVCNIIYVCMYICNFFILISRAHNYIGWWCKVCDNTHTHTHTRMSQTPIPDTNTTLMTDIHEQFSFSQSSMFSTTQMSLETTNINITMLEFYATNVMDDLIFLRNRLLGQIETLRNLATMQGRAVRQWLHTHVVTEERTILFQDVICHAYQVLVNCTLMQAHVEKYMECARTNGTM